MFRRLWFALLIVVVATPLLGQRRQPRQRGIPAYYQALEAIEDDGTRGRIVLRNGLRVLIDEFTIRPVAAVVSTFNVGQAQAAPPEILFELGRRLWLNGQLSRKMHELGGWNEFEAGLYETSFISIVPAENVLDTLTIHQQILSADLSESDAAVQSSPAASGLSDLEMRLWRQTFGESEQNLAERPSDEKLLAFRNQYLHVGNLVLGVSGRILRTNIYERVVTLYARQKAGDKVRRPKVDVTLGDSFDYLHLRRKSPSARVLMGYRVPPEGHPDALGIEMIRALLSEGRGSLLRRTQVDAGFSVQADAELIADRQHRLLQLDLSPREEKVDSAELGILSLLGVLADQGPPEADLVRAKSQLVRRYFERRQHVRERAMGMARHELAGNHKDYWNRAKRLAGLDGSAIRTLVARYFKIENLVLIEQFPESGEIRNFEASTLKQTFDLLLAPEREKLAKELRTTPEADIKDLAFSDFKPVLLDPPLKRTSVLRGPDIYLEEEHTVPLVAAGFYFPGGRADEVEQISGITELMLRGLLAGIEEKHGVDVWTRFETRGARFEIINEPEYFGIEVTVLADAFSPLLKDLVDWFQKPIISEEGFDRVRAQVMALGEAARAQPAKQADLEIRSRLFKDHPYGSNRYGNPTSLSRLTAEEAKGWAARQMVGFHPFIVIRGHLSGTSFLPPLVPVLSNSKLKIKPVPELEEPKGDSYAVTSLLDRLWAGFRAPRRGSFDAWALRILQSYLLLRDGELPVDEKLEPLDHGVALDYRNFFNGGVLTLDTRLEGSAEETQKRLFEILTEFDQAPIREEQVLRAVVLAITRYHQSQEDSPGHLRELAHNLLAGEKIGYREEYLATIKGIQTSDLRSLAGRIFGETQQNPDEGTTPR